MSAAAPTLAFMTAPAPRSPVSTQSVHSRFPLRVVAVMVWPVARRFAPVSCTVSSLMSTKAASEVAPVSLSKARTASLPFVLRTMMVVSPACATVRSPVMVSPVTFTKSASWA